jgi:hypothetical protein
MKTIVFGLLLATFALTSCNSVRVYTDFDKNVSFTPYKTYAFFKSGIDKAEISDLDKRRILRSIEQHMTAKGYTLSEKPDFLINFFTKERQQTTVSNFGYGWGWGWSPWMWGGTSVNSYPEGSLYIDIVDAKNNELVWQGEGVGALTRYSERKDAVFDEFVSRILSQFPPDAKKTEKVESNYP